MPKTLRQKCWDAFSEMIRAKYADWRGYVSCYTCGAIGRWKGDKFQCGHFQAGRGNAVLFDEEGVRVQCYKCNCGENSGEQYKFGKNLEREVGIEKVKELQKRRAESVKYSPKDYESMIKVFKVKTEMYKEEKCLND